MITIRPATPSDEEHLGRFLVSQISNPNSVVRVAEHSGAVVGQVFADVEPTNWVGMTLDQDIQGERQA
ncbi:MAG: hypothetical protein HOP12_02420 [Candidatus Eisenbacteria bacterium]|uniref:GNAT family N-acetyltransferase n=1 Tax=Eiseniibacteriota bacterium TaxID=2212470 RepID=A0A849SM96_UNCEI|nr:hypothetical protein [Candidatus Eisenbacteria bacterium]